MKTYKRLLSALLVLLMCVSLFPVSAFAADEELEPADAAEAVESVEPAAKPAEEIAPQDVEPEDDEGEVAIAADGITLTGATGTELDGSDGYYTYQVEIDPGETKTLSVEASGDGLTYAWTAGWEELDENGNSITVTCSSGGPLRYVCEISDSNSNYLSVTFNLMVDSPMFLADAEGDLGNMWSPEGRPDITNWNSYVACEIGDTVELWVEVGGLSDEEMADVTYKWTQRVMSDQGYMTSVNTGETGAAFPTFEMEEECSYACEIKDGYGNIINVAFDVTEGTPGPGPGPGESSLTVADAAGDLMGQGEGNWNYMVPGVKGEEVELWVEVGGLSDEELADVTYSWHKAVRDENGQVIDFEPIEGEEVDYFAFTFTQSETYLCQITDGYGETIYVFFNVVDNTPTPYIGFYGTTAYRTTAGIPVRLGAELMGADDLDVFYQWMSWNAASKTWLFLDMTEDPELVVNPSVTTQYQLGALDDNGDWIATLNMTVEVVPAGQVVNLDQDYYILAPDESVTLYAPAIPPYWCAETVWISQNEDAVEITPDGSSCIATAIEEGTSFISWIVYAVDGEGNMLFGENGEPMEPFRLRCRVDVMAGSIEDAIETDNYSLGVHLPEAAATTNVYSTDYTRVTLLVDLKNNQIDTQGMYIDRDEEGNELDNNGAVIEDAWFTDPAAKEVFALRVVDDRTLEIVPNIDFTTDYAAAVAGVKGKYTSAVTVKFKDVDQTVDTDNKLALTVKKTLPKVTAKAVKLNSFIPGDGAMALFSPQLSSIRPDPDKTQPGWVQMFTAFNGSGQIGLYVCFNGEQGKSCSGKVYVKVTPAGYAVEVPVAISVKAAKTAPKLKAGGTITLNPQYATDDRWDYTNFKGTPISVNPLYMAGRLSANIVKITEGKTEYTVAGAPIECSLRPDDAGYYLNTRVKDPETFDSTKARTFKVTVAVGGDRTGKGGVTTTVTVKTLATGAKPSAKVKASGTIDTMITGSYATLKWSETNTSGLSLRVRIEQYNGTQYVGDATGQFNRIGYAPYEIRVSEKERGTAVKGSTYYAVFSYVDTTEEYDEVLIYETKVKLPIKWSDTRAKITATMKASGSIDLIRPESAVTLTPTLKNCYTDIYPKDLEIATDKSFAAGTVVEYEDLPFDLNMDYYTGKFTVKLKNEYRGVLTTADKYYARINIRDTLRTDGLEVKSAAVQIKLTKGSAKVTPSVKSVVLLKHDLFSSAEFSLQVPAGCAPIKEAVLDAKSEARFDLVMNGAGGYELQIDPLNPLTTKGTAKILVTLEGNTTGKPDATVSIAVKFA